MKLDDLYVEVDEIKCVPGSHPKFLYDWGDKSTTDWPAHGYLRSGRYNLTITAITSDGESIPARPREISLYKTAVAGAAAGTLIFRNLPVGPWDLAHLARIASLGGHAFDVIGQLFELHALKAYAYIDGCHHYASLDDRWHRNHAALDSQLSSLNANEAHALRGRFASAPARRTTTNRSTGRWPGSAEAAWLLLALVSPDDLADFRVQAVAANSSQARSQGWYRRLADQHIDADLELAQLWLMQNAAPLATKQYQEQEKVEREQREAERRRQEELRQRQEEVRRKQAEDERRQLEEERRRQEEERQRQEEERRKREEERRRQLRQSGHDLADALAELTAAAQDAQRHAGAMWYGSPNISSILRMTATYLATLSQAAQIAVKGRAAVTPEDRAVLKGRLPTIATGLVMLADEAIGAASCMRQEAETKAAAYKIVSVTPRPGPAPSQPNNSAVQELQNYTAITIGALLIGAVTFGVGRTSVPAILIMAFCVATVLACVSQLPRCMKAPRELRSDTRRYQSETAAHRELVASYRRNEKHRAELAAAAETSNALATQVAPDLNRLGRLSLRVAGLISAPFIEQVLLLLA